MRDQRSLKNILVKPNRHLKVVIYTFGVATLISSLSMMALIASLIFSFSDLSSRNALPLDAHTQFIGLLKITLACAGVFGIGTIVLALSVGLLVSHRVFGPMVPISAQINELIAGNYQARGKLRGNDLFHEIMGGLNQLAEKLDRRPDRTP